MFDFRRSLSPVYLPTARALYPKALAKWSRKSTQVHARLGQTEWQVDASARNAWPNGVASQRKCTQGLAKRSGK